jgi:hypothetical protein
MNIRLGISAMIAGLVGAMQLTEKVLTKDKQPRSFYNKYNKTSKGKRHQSLKSRSNRRKGKAKCKKN